MNATTVWARVGDHGDYEPFNTLDGAIDYLNDLSVGKVLRWVNGTYGVGVETVNYWGRNFISLFIGDCHADLIRPLNKAERAEVRGSLVEAYG
jgi:hypothetical protein